MQQMDECIAGLLSRVRGTHDRPELVVPTMADCGRDMAASYVVNQDSIFQIGWHVTSQMVALIPVLYKGLYHEVSRGFADGQFVFNDAGVEVQKVNTPEFEANG
jgi:hypothetical protein